MDVDGHRVEVSNAEKLLFPKSGVTKSALAEYYRRIGETALPFLKNRALTMHRFPDGIEQNGFFQKDAPDHFPKWIERAILKKEGGETAYVVANSVATLVYLADQACITPHSALSKVDKPDNPDRLVFDLDPATDDFAEVRWAALQLHDCLNTLDLSSFVKTTGSRGLHVEVFLDRSASFDETRAFAKAVAKELVDRAPERLTIAHRKDQRGARVFIDYLRNAYGQTAVAPYAVRAISGAPIATPLDWREVSNASLSPQRYRIDNIFRRLGQKNDPWSNFFEHPASIREAMAKLKASVS